MIEPAQPFGKRGRSTAKSARPSVVAPSVCAQSATVPAALTLPPELVASILQPEARVASSESMARKASVPRSLRAALLAGLCVGFFSAALNITATPSLGKELAPLLGDMALPLPAISIFLGLWSAARTSMMSLLVTQRILNYCRWTHHIAYALGGGATALAYAGVIHLLGPGLPHHGFGVEFITGLGAGFFYRLFAGTVVADGA
jgi:hypothetical protein